jgi:hypothetical protein
MRIGLIDVDAESRGKVTFPNLSLMKISAWHKSQGDHVEWYKPLVSGHMDLVYMSKVFGDEYTKDYEFPIDADRIIKGGSGYAISIVDGKEVYNKELDEPLDSIVDHMMPDYSLYGITDTAYGFLTRGCPRACPFCHVAEMQGRRVWHNSQLGEWWDGQKNIVLLDPNITASPCFDTYMNMLEHSGAWCDFSQGLDLRLMDEKKIEALNRVKWKRIHFAWDNPNDDMLPKLKMVMAGLKRANRRTITVYILTNFNSTHEQDLMRVMAVREAGAQPDVRIYRKPTAPKITRQLARWVNAPNIFWSVPTFEEYKGGM